MIHYRQKTKSRESRLYHFGTRLLTYVLVQQIQDRQQRYTTNNTNMTRSKRSQRPEQDCEQQLHGPTQQTPAEILADKIKQTQDDFAELERQAANPGSSGSGG